MHEYAEPKNNQVLSRDRVELSARFTPKANFPQHCTNHFQLTLYCPMTPYGVMTFVNSP